MSALYQIYLDGMDIHVSTVLRTSSIKNASDLDDVAGMSVVPGISDIFHIVGFAPNALTAVISRQSLASSTPSGAIWIVIQVDPSMLSPDHHIPNYLSSIGDHLAIVKSAPLHELGAGNHFCIRPRWAQA